MPRIRTIVFSLALALLLYATLVAGIDAERTLAAMRKLDMRWWLAILALSLFNYGLRFVRWHGYLRWLGDRVGLWRDGLIYIAGFALTTTPGKAGEGMRSVYLVRHGVSYAHSLAAFFAERRVDGRAQAVLLTRALDEYAPLDEWFERWDRLAVADVRMLIRSAAALVRALHNADRIHNCLYPKHVFLKLHTDGAGAG